MTSIVYSKFDSVSVPLRVHFHILENRGNKDFHRIGETKNTEEGANVLFGICDTNEKIQYLIKIPSQNSSKPIFLGGLSVKDMG